MIQAAGRKLGAIAVTAAVVLVACGGPPFSTNLESREDGSVAFSDGSPGIDANARHDASEQTDATSMDAEGDARGEASAACPPGHARCDGPTRCVPPPAVNASYVAVGGGFPSPGCGGPSAPCAKLEDGVQYAHRQSLADVYVAGGTYAGQGGPIVLTPLDEALRIHGGWVFTPPSTWSFGCSSSSTILAAPPGASSAVQIGSGDVTLEFMTIENETRAAPGQSLYGIFASGGRVLALHAVDVRVAPGGAGSGGSKGSGASLPAPGPFGACAASDGWDARGAGADGAMGRSSYDAQGFEPGAGGAGQAGRQGDNGTAGGAGQTLQGKADCHVEKPDPPPPRPPPPQPRWPAPPQPHQAPPHIVLRMPPVCLSTPQTYGGAAAGQPGCGSTGSGGGTGGGGGGASIGVFAWGEDLTLDDGAISTGAGGAGGSGGAAGDCVAGSPGTPGPTTYATVCTCDGRCQLSCMTHVLLAAGAPGGKGGTGSPGGAGGGGAGGDSYCFVVAGGARATSSAACAPGTGGAGGSSRASASGASPRVAPSGASGAHN